MTEDERRQAWSACINSFGANAQTDRAVEKLSDLISGLMRYKQSDSMAKVREELATEIAAVKVMMGQLELIFDCEDDIQFLMDFETRRQLEEIKKG